jgi:hypothetical protein
MTTIARVLSFLVLLLERIKGEQVFVLARLDPKAISHLVGQSLIDYEIHIHCQRKQYAKIYRRWPWLKRTYVLYRVFSVITGTAPRDIVEACQIEVDIPAQLPSFVDDDLQRMKAVNAYLDLVIARLTKS